jgi:hypothetical protein
MTRAQRRAVTISRKLDERIHGDFEPQWIATCAASSSVRDQSAAEIERAPGSGTDFQALRSAQVHRISWIRGVGLAGSTVS